MSACRLVDMLIGDVETVLVEEKLVSDDRFDDLTTIDSNGTRERIQLKHTNLDDRPLAASTFRNDSRRLRLDRLFASMLADRQVPGQGSEVPETSYRVVLRDGPPIDDHLSTVLVPASNDPGPFIKGLRTHRLAFDPHALWAQLNRDDASSGGRGETFALLSYAVSDLSMEDLIWACTHLMIEVDSPSSSSDLHNPDTAEQFLMTRVREEVGAGHFPNRHRSPLDVGASLIGTVRAARLGTIQISRAEILSRAQLRSDFGAVTRAHPVNHSVEVPRTPVAKFLAHKTTEVAAEGGGFLTLVGPPGHGKSWLCHQVLEELRSQDWLVAEHYCYLGDADGEKTERVLADRVFGSLVSRLIDADPSLRDDHFPRFAASAEALEQILCQCKSRDPDRLVALVVDGIDHVTRVLASEPSRYDPSFGLAASLAELTLPAGVTVIVLSQPGTHITPLADVAADEVEVDGLSEHEIRALAIKAGIHSNSELTDRDDCTKSDLDEHAAEALLDELVARSGGNALYATYLCREIKQQRQDFLNPLHLIKDLPPYNGSLENYYGHLCESLDHDAGWVADVMALVDFAMSRDDLCAIQPTAAHRVDASLRRLAPALVYRAMQGGFLIYHESFARYLRKVFDSDKSAAISLTDQISRWLESKGFFADDRAYRSLIPLMTAANRHSDVVDKVDEEFVIRSIESGFPASAINTNLASAIQSATVLGDWSAIVRCVELSRSAEAFQFGQFDSTLSDFADVPISLFGAETVAARLTHEGNVVMPARIGLHICAILDSQGAVAPWLQYMHQYAREFDFDNSSYDLDSDIAASLAWLRGRLRLTVASSDPGPSRDASTASQYGRTVTAVGDRTDGEICHRNNPLGPFSWKVLGEQVRPDEIPVPEVAKVVLETVGVGGIQELISFVEEPGDLCIAVAKRLGRTGVGDGDLDPKYWVMRAVGAKFSPGVLHELVKLGVPIDQVAEYSKETGRERLLSLTLEVQNRSTATDIDTVNRWLDECTIAAQCDPLSLDAAEAIIAGDGWHKCWLRYSISLTRAEAMDTSKQSLAEISFQHLTGDLRPLVGQPRACDLYEIHTAIESTIRRGVELVDGDLLDRTLRLLFRVSNAITTTLRGSMGGPLPPRLVAQLASESDSSVGKGIARDILQEAITDHSSGRYYADIAEMHLRHARLALTCGDREEARRAWRVACELLTAYGFRKDITVFEVLDPLPSLIEADIARSRRLLAMMQPLCNRVVNHTDGSETSWAPTVWWRSLSKADPLAMAQLAANRLLSECNDGNERLHGAMEDLWRFWHAQADPFLAASLRLSIDAPLDTSDANSLSLLSRDLDLGDSSNRSLATWVLARADERPVEYSYSNGHENLARDDRRVEAINLVANEADLPLITKIPEFRSVPTEPERRSRGSRNQGGTVEPFMAGSGGIGQAIRAWSRRPYQPTGSSWEVDRFANAIGYRLLELVGHGRTREAEGALGLLSEETRFGERAEIWPMLAEGFERRGLSRLASISHTIPWIHARRDHGSATVANLKRAKHLDANATTEHLTGEIQKMVSNASGSFETLGLTKSLIHGFAVGALQSECRPSIDLAFECWEAAFRVIARRAPRIDSSDDPLANYQPAVPNGGLIEQREIDEAFALATVASLAHPAREKKRRTLLAIRTLILKRPEWAGIALNFALTRLTCAATTTWILSLLEQPIEPCTEAISQCRQALTQLATSNFICVRNAANRLLRYTLQPVSSLNVPLQAPLPVRSPSVLTPSSPTNPHRDQSVDELIESVAGQRIEECEWFMPSLRQVVTNRVASMLGAPQIRRRLSEFSRQFLSPVSVVSPDTFDVLHETVENQFQVVAGELGGSHGGVPEEFQVPPNDLASILQNDPSIALDFEALRIPRPPATVLPAIELGSLEHAQVIKTTPHGITPAVNTSSRSDPRLDAHEFLERSHAGVSIYGLQRDWKFLAAIERIQVRHREPGINQARSKINVRAIEVRERGDVNGLDSPPLSLGDVRHWFVDSQRYAIAPSHSGARPLFGIDSQLHGLSDGNGSLGGRQLLLTPTPLFNLILGLQPKSSFVLGDDDGAAVVLVHWRTAYEVNDFELTWPQVVGCGVFVRPDLCEKLMSLTDDELVSRDYTNSMN